MRVFGLICKALNFSLSIAMASLLLMSSAHASVTHATTSASEPESAEPVSPGASTALRLFHETPVAELKFHARAEREWAARLAPVTRAQEMSELVALYNSRFQLPENQRAAVRAQFTQAQAAAIQKWLTSGALLKVLEVHNDTKPGLVYTVYTLRDEVGGFLALVYDQSRFDDDLDRSLLRLMHTAMLKTGVSFVGIGDLAAVRFQLASLGATSGRLNLDYALDIKKQRFARIDLELRQESSGWTLFDLVAQRAVHSVMLEFWFNIFTRNGGVKSISLDSRS